VREPLNTDPVCLTWEPHISLDTFRAEWQQYALRAITRVEILALGGALDRSSIDQAIRIVSEFPGWNAVKSLYLAGRIREDGLSLQPDFFPPHLCDLVLSFFPIGLSEARALVDHGCFACIEKLAIMCPSSMLAVSEIVKAQSGSTLLKELALRQTGFDNATMNVLLSDLRLGALEELSISENVTDSGVEPIFREYMFPSLRRLHLNWATRLTEESLYRIARGRMATQLTHLSFAAFPSEPTEHQQMELRLAALELLGVGVIRELDLTGCQFVPEHEEAIREEAQRVGCKFIFDNP
jgi:hypothetical protein